MANKVVTLTPNSALDIWTSTRRVESGPKLRCDSPRIDPGGGGINVSRVLHRLGAETLAVFSMGGCAGEALAEALGAEGVPAAEVGIGQETRQSFNIRDEEAEAVLRFVLPGPELTREEGDALLDRAGEALSDGDFLVGSGSLPPGVGDDFWVRAARVAERKGARFLLDSSSGVEAALGAGVFVLRVNHDEAASLAGKRLAWPDKAADWAAARVADGDARMVIVTEGAKGAILVSADDRIHISPPQVEVRSAIGAGDSFMAGFCLGLMRGDAPGEALRLAVATAAATLLTPGTELARPEDVERLAGECGAPEAI